MVWIENKEINNSRGIEIESSGVEQTKLFKAKNVKNLDLTEERIKDAD